MSGRGIIYERLGRKQRTPLDGPLLYSTSSRGPYDFRGVVQKVIDLRAGIDCIERLIELPRATLLAWGLTDADLAELEHYLARRGFHHAWSVA